MFTNIREFFCEHASLKVDASNEPTAHDKHVALVVLLCSVAYSDSAISPEELGSIFKSMAQALGLEGAEAGEILEIADFIRRDQGERLDEFIEAVNAHFETLQREHLLGLAWRVISADGSASRIETAFAAGLRKKLGLTLEQAVRARQLAELDHTSE